MKKIKLNNNSKGAFTLAEVLITLVIIGTVAAITMPSLVANNNKSEIQSKIKKEYSTLTNAFTMTQADGFVLGKGRGADLDELSESIAKHLNVAKTCASGDYSCMPSSYSYLLSSEGSRIRPDLLSSYLLNDGSSITIASDVSSAPGYSLAGNQYKYGIEPSAYALVDINAAKEPNTWGKDMFLFMIYWDGIFPFKKSECNDSGVMCSGEAIYGDMSYIEYYTDTNFSCTADCMSVTGMKCVSK